MTDPNTATLPLRKMARIHGKPGRGEALRHALIELEAETRHEPGCSEFAFYGALSAPDEFLLVETFRDAAALATHMNAPHTRRFFDAALVEAIDVTELPAA